MEERSFHPLDYVSVVRRRKWWFIVPLAACVFVGALLAMFLPRTYVSYAEIGIAAPTLSPEILRGVSSLDKDERQRAVSQQLLSRTVLERVVREERLNPSSPVEETAARLRANVERNIVVPQPIGRTELKNGLDSFHLGYVDSTPERAQRIANRLAMVFVEENSKRNTEQAENTSEVLGQQMRASQERLAKLQEQLRAKKEMYMGRLPSQTDANVQMVNGLRNQLESVSMQLRAETERLGLVESQLDAMRQGSSSAGMTSAGAALINTAQSRMNGLAQELTQVRAMGYTDAHPDVIRIKGEMEEAQKELAAARKQTPGNRDDVLMADPIYRDKIEERDATKLRISSLRAAENRARRQIAGYESRVEAAPMVEQELFSLVQEHELEKARYGDLTNKYQSALMVEDLARKQGGERFSVLYPAFMPSRPISPKILRLMLMALALGLVLGSAAVVGREFFDRSVHDARALTEFEVPVLGEIPRIHGAA